MKKRTIFGLAATALAVLAISLPWSCAREPKFKVPPLGQTFLVLPQVVNSNKPLNDYHDTPAIRIYAMWGSRPLISSNGNPTVKFYDDLNKPPKYTFLWSELENAWRSDKCTNEMIETMDGPIAGYALICDGSLTMKGIIQVEAVNDHGGVRKATSWGQHKITDDVLAVSLRFH